MKDDVSISSDHVSFLLPFKGGDVIERGGPVWSGMYPPGSSLQHAAQLQLLSQQQMLRQQELLMIQQHTAQVLELQRNAQFVVSRFSWYTNWHIIKQRPIYGR